MNFGSNPVLNLLALTPLDSHQNARWRNVFNVSMRLFSIFFLGLLMHAAYAETAVQVCKGPNGEKYYENTSTVKKNCRKVESDALSVIPASSRKQRLPISIGMSQDQVENNWGKPVKVTKVYTRSGMTEQWEYKGGTLTFANGVLEVIEQ